LPRHALGALLFFGGDLAELGVIVIQGGIESILRGLRS